jgi:hypothetical protein
LVQKVDDRWNVEADLIRIIAGMSVGALERKKKAEAFIKAQ